MQIPLDPKIETLHSVPYTISYIIRKRQQVDSLSELPKEKRVPELDLWFGSQEDIEDWLDKVLNKGQEKDSMLIISEDEIE